MMLRAAIAKLFPFLLALAVFFLGVATDHLAGNLSSNRLFAIADDLVVGVVLGSVVLFYDRRRRRYLALCLRVIGEMNHHVRNALQVISMVALQQGDEEVKSLMRESVLRIDWALREVLPGDTDNDFVSDHSHAPERTPGLFEPSSSELPQGMEAVVRHPAAPFASMRKCARPVGRLDREGNEPMTYAVIQVFASESRELLARMKSVHLEHLGSLVSSFVSCAKATGSPIDVHLEIR